MHEDSEGYVVVHVGWQPGCPGGRRPRGFRPRRVDPTRSTLAAWFAGLHQLEAASVPAFETLRRELARAGAPASLRRAAASAARDEIRHARLTAALARRYGGHPRSPSVAATPRRSLAAMAEENAIEGCVREAYGAALVCVQARSAGDPVVRDVMQVIARDEARHAALAFAVDAWVRPQLSRAARRRIDGARDAAVDQLDAHAGRDWTPALGTLAGLPDRTSSRALLAGLRETLWV
jgi:hypothetical protein